MLEYGLNQTQLHINEMLEAAYNGDGHCRVTDTTGKINFAPPQHEKFYQLSLLCCFSILPHKFYPMMTYFW